MVGFTNTLNKRKKGELICSPFKVINVFTYSIAHRAESCKLKTLKTKNFKLVYVAF